MAFVAFEGILHYHHLHFDFIYKGDDGNMPEMYNMVNASLIHVCQSYFKTGAYNIL